MESKLTLCQRFQSLKNHINTELRGIRATYPEEIEYVANQIDSLASYIKDNLKYNDSSAVAQTALVARVASDAQNENAYAEPAVPTANNFFDSCRPQPDGQHPTRLAIAQKSRDRSAHAGRRPRGRGRLWMKRRHGAQSLDVDLLASRRSQDG